MEPLFIALMNIAYVLQFLHDSFGEVGFLNQACTLLLQNLHKLLFSSLLSYWTLCIQVYSIIILLDGHCTLP